MAPTVTAVSPNTGSTLGGLTVNVSGTGFSVSPPTVAFGGFAASNVSVQSDTFLSCVSPSYPVPGVLDVVVTTTAGSSATSSADHFTYSFPLGNGVEYIKINPYLDLFATYTTYGTWTFANTVSFYSTVIAPNLLTAAPSGSNYNVMVDTLGNFYRSTTPN